MTCAQRTATTGGAWSDATGKAAPNAGGDAFLVTREQIEQLILLAESVSANTRVVAVGDAAEPAGQALPEASNTLCVAADEVRKLLLQIAYQPLREQPSNRVREARAVYVLELEAPPASDGWLH
jgi:hypothetical protein